MEDVVDYMEKASECERKAAETTNEHAREFFQKLAKDYRALALPRRSPSIVPKDS